MKYAIYACMLVTTVGMMLLTGEKLLEFNGRMNDNYRQKIDNFDPKMRHHRDVRRETLPEGNRFGPVNATMKVEARKLPPPGPLPVTPKPKPPVKKFNPANAAMAAQVYVNSHPIVRVIGIFRHASYLHEMEEMRKEELREAYKSRLDNRRKQAAVAKRAIGNRLKRNAASGPPTIVIPHEGVSFDLRKYLRPWVR